MGPDPTAHEISRSLREFAEKHLRAEHYDDCEHRFWMASCRACGASALQLAIERLEGDEPHDFHGHVWKTCVSCGFEAMMLGVEQLGTPPAKGDADPVVCECGGRSFYTAQCERWETWGFFDEGTIVAMCVSCGALQAVVDTD